MLKRISVFASLLVLVTAILTVPAFPADPKDPKVIGEDKPVVFTFPGVRTADGMFTQTVYCTTVPSPRPQYSPSGGGWVHWGAKMTCSIPGELRLDVYLVQWDNGYMYTQASAPTAYAVGYVLWNGGSTPCVGYDPTLWQVRYVPTFDHIPGEPPEGYSAKVQLNCS